MNLFDVTHGIALPGQNKPKPRPANENEIKAYLIWLADRRGIWLPHDAEYGLDGVYSKSAGGMVLDMPGYGQDQCVTMETLDESGEVVASQTLPVEPKKGGVIWDKAAVRKACGPVAKPAKGKRAKVAAPIPVAAPAVEPVEAQEAVAPTCDVPEPEIAPSAAPAVDLDAITARLDALEQALATLSAVSVDDREVTTSPVAVTAVASCDHLPKRTPAHERAIRRAWAERKARRGAQGGMAIHARRIDALETELRLAKDEQALDKQALSEAYARAEQFARRGNQHRDRRLATARRARRMIGAARSQERIAQARASAARAEIDRLKRDMADPSQPERASDIARLVRERDEARTALAAVTARAERAEQGLHSMADRFEALVSRVTRAEAALRQQNVA